VEEELLSTEEEGDEFLLMGLRLREGVDPERFRALAGRRLDDEARRATQGVGHIWQQWVNRQRLHDGNTYRKSARAGKRPRAESEEQEALRLKRGGNALTVQVYQTVGMQLDGRPTFWIRR